MPETKPGIDSLMDTITAAPKVDAPAAAENEITVEDVDENAAVAADGDPDASIEEVATGSTKPWPEWASVPDGLKLPTDCPILAVRFRGNLTRRPKGGDRVVILWDLTEADEKLAIERTRGKSNRTIDEMAKQMIRAIDGVKVDWSKPGPQNPSTLYTEIGGKCREQLKIVYVQRHRMNTAEQLDFLANCIVAGRPAG